MVTGGAKGIGAATARRLASEGATVVVADFDEEGAQRTAAEIGGHAVRCDVTKLADVEAAVEAAKEHGGSVDILVTCAGIIRDNLLFKMTDDDWSAVIDTHLKGTFHAVRAAQKHMVEQKRREDGADLVDVGARQPRTDELLDREGGTAGDDEDARDRARPVQRERELRRAGLHRHRHDAPDRGARRRPVSSSSRRLHRRRCRSGAQGSRRTSPARSRSSARRTPAT